MEVGCPWARGLQPQLHPKAEEHPQAYQPATQPRAPLRQAPNYSTCHTEARSPVEVKWTNLRSIEREGGGVPKPREQRQGGRGTKRNATLLEHHTTLTKLRVQRKHNVGTWPLHAPMRHTAGQESAPHAYKQWWTLQTQTWSCNSTTDG